MNYRKMFNPAGLKIPVKSTRAGVKALSVSKGFVPPAELLLDGYCTPVENQGATPQCAAYAASSFAESVLWRKTGRPVQIAPEPLYRYAKTIDGDPKGDGTYLECVLKALVQDKLFPKTCQVRTFGNEFFGLGSSGGLLETKFAVHRYGCCLGGFDITDEWFSPERAVIRGKAGHKAQGGHAVLVCGYDKGGVLVMNSWGGDYGHDGKVYITNEAFDRQFMYGAVLTRVLDGLE